MTVVVEEHDGRHLRSGGRLSRSLYTLIRVLQLTCVITTFVYLTMHHPYTDVPHFLGQQWYMVAQVIAGIAMLYTMIAPVLAWLLGGRTLYTCCCMLVDIFFLLAFIGITILLFFDPFCAHVSGSGLSYEGCEPGKPTFIAPLVAAILFFVAIPLQICTNWLRQRKRHYLAEDESPTVALTRAPKSPFWRRARPGLATSNTQSSRPTTPYWSPAVGVPMSSSTAPRRETDRVNPWDRLARGWDDHRAEPSATPETRPQGGPAGRRSLSDIPQGDGPAAEPWPSPQLTLAEALTKDVRAARASEPETSWCCMRKKSPYRKAKEPRPRWSRSSGSMSRPWGLQPPPGIPY